MIRNSGSQPVLVVPSLENPGTNNRRPVTVTCTRVRPRNSLVLLKMLFSRNFDGNILSDFERMLVILSWENVISKVKHDPSFSGSYFREVITLDHWIKSLTKNPKTYISHTLDYQDYDLVYTRDAQKGFFNKLNTIEEERNQYFRISEVYDKSVPTRELPVPRFIGVGYKDKGSSRIPCLDGSHSWQELAVSLEVSHYPGGKSGTNFVSVALISVKEVIHLPKNERTVEFFYTRQQNLSRFEEIQL